MVRRIIKTELPVEGIGNSKSLVSISQNPNQVSSNTKKEGFRVKKTANIALIVFASLSVVLAIGATAAAIGTGFALAYIAIPLFVTIQVVAGIVALTSLTALAILGFLKAWQLITPHLPDFIRVPLNHIQASICGFFSACVLAVIWPLDYTKKNIKPEDVDPSKPLIIGIHGFMGSSNNWIYHFKRFKEAGYNNLASINLGNCLESINDEYIEKVRKLVLEYKKGVKLPPGEKLKIQFVCHSMGGLVAREYNQRFSEMDDVEIEDIITLGTPLDGTRVAYLSLGMMLGQSKAGKQMFYRSKFVKNQQEIAAQDDKTHFFHIASKCDYVIRPLFSAVKGNGKHTETATLDGTGHVSYLFSDKAADLVIDYLDRSEARRARKKAELSV